MKTLFKNCDILLYSDKYYVLKNAYLGVDNDKIDYISDKMPQDNYDVQKDFSNHLLMAGLINSHTHLPMTLLRGMGSDLPLDKWLNDVIFPAEEKFVDNDFYVGTQLGMLELLRGGVVSFSDMYFGVENILKAVTECGMKANLSACLVGFDKSVAYKDCDRAKSCIDLFKNYHNLNNGKIKIDLSIHAEYTSYDEIVKGFADDCRSLGARHHIHLSETEKEHNDCINRHGKTPTEWFYDLGVLDNPTSLAHCVWLSEDDIQILAEKNAVLVHCPTSNMKLGSGFMPISRLLDSGVNIAIGTDGAASNNNLNMFEEMHLASVIHKGYTEDPTVVSPESILKFATINGAIAQSRLDTGKLEVGMKADIIAIDLDQPHLVPMIDAPSLLVYSAQASDVDMTMIDGEILYYKGEYKTLDKDKILFEARKSIQRILK